MIRVLLVFIIATFFLQAKTSVDENIKHTSSKITSSSKNYSSINKKMADTARAILKQKTQIQKQQKQLNELKNELLQKETVYESDTTKLKNLSKKQSSLKVVGDKLEEELLFTIAQSVSLSIVLDEDIAVSEESLLEFEILKVMLVNSKKRVKELNRKFYTNSTTMSNINKHANLLEKVIKNIDNKRKKVLNIQKKNKKALQKLHASKSAYKKELQILLAKQDTLKKTLEKLNIIKVDEIKKAKEKEARRKAFKDMQVVSNDNLPKVKKHGSSYKKVKTKKYRGPKTIAPFSPYTITKRYGTYTDPIYGIKVFNESISLKPKKRNTKVKTVFNGKVIYADKTAVLNNIVIVQHKNGLHTIYANLSQISPKIKKGKKIKKGYTIGRVSEELIFEVTQKSFHINPIRLFK